ncbi:hypothetical protein [Lacibacter sp. H407]|uniref:hypothetical protein n=1 Tax=Lacibacter sp. H407 TaxID=3133423 RepID=UPI0030C63C6F
MRVIITISFLFSTIVCLSQKSKQNLLIERKLDSIINIVQTLQNKTSDSTLIRIDKLDEVFKKTDTKWYDKYLPALIALVTVILSSGVAYYVGVRNAKTQIVNAERQAKTQIAIAADQLEMSRRQIDQNTANTLAQIRANNISKARIDWIQNLRAVLSTFFANAAEASSLIEDMKLAKAKNKTDEVLKVYESFTHILFKMKEQDNQIQLMLNPTNQNHQNLINSMDAYIEYLFRIDGEQDKKAQEELSGKVISDSRKVIKEAWEKAKSETNI